MIRDSALLAGLIYGGGRTALRPQLQEQILEGRHIAVATLKGSASLPAFNSTLHALLKTGRFAVSCLLAFQLTIRERSTLTCALNMIHIAL